jgi:phosphoglycerate kinase
VRVLTPHLIADKTVLLRIDMDVPLGHIKDNGVDRRIVLDDFRLRAALPTIYLCLQYAEKVIIMGHIGRPNGEEPELSVAPIVDWLDREIPDFDFPTDRLQVLENLRFEKGEDDCDENYARELASLGNFFVNESFAAHHNASSTVLLPQLLPSSCGFHFDHEVRILRQVHQNPQKPLVAIIGGAKIEDKLAVVEAMSKVADHVLLGGKLPYEIKEKNIALSENVLVGEMDESGFDLSPKTIEHFKQILSGAQEVVWSGPMGKYEEGFQKGNSALAESILYSGAQSIIGGGDTLDALNKLGVLEQFSFVSTGGGAMLKFLAEGTLPTIEALNHHG